MVKVTDELISLDGISIAKNKTPAKTHSYRSESTGLATAALMDWKETVTNEMTKATPADTRKISQPIMTRKAKF